MRIGELAAEVPVVVTDDGTFDLRALTDDITPEFFANNGVEDTAEALRAGRLMPSEDAARSGVRIGAPIGRPGAVVCVGMNYAAHAAESGSEPPTEPVIFLKHPNTVIGPFDPIALPPGSSQFDWEVELAIVIGKRARYLPSVRHAREHIAGFTISNDLSERHFQLEVSGGQWSKGKCFEKSNPLGPAIVTPDEFDPDAGVQLRSWVNGQPRQSSSTSDLIFSADDIIFRLSQFMVLEPGDIVNTGTPEGVALSGRFPYLAVGDVVECAIDGIGVQRQLLEEAQAS